MERVLRWHSRAAYAKFSGSNTRSFWPEWAGRVSPRSRPQYRMPGDLAFLALRPARQTSCAARSEEHTSELQSLMRISYAVFCLNKKKNQATTHNHVNNTEW